MEGNGWFQFGSVVPKKSPYFKTFFFPNFNYKNVFTIRWKIKTFKIRQYFWNQGTKKEPNA
jgi:hypothetical protein